MSFEKMKSQKKANMIILIQGMITTSVGGNNGPACVRTSCVWRLLCSMLWYHYLSQGNIVI